MRVTIIHDTGTVNVDGKAHHDLDMSGLPEDFQRSGEGKRSGSRGAESRINEFHGGVINA